MARPLSHTLPRLTIRLEDSDKLWRLKQLAVERRTTVQDLVLGLIDAELARSQATNNATTAKPQATQRTKAALPQAPKPPPKRASNPEVLRDRIAKMLAMAKQKRSPGSDAMNVTEIMGELDEGRSAVARVLAAGLKDKRFVRVARGRYRSA